MKIESSSINFLDNLAQHKFGSKHYDFHNDFECVKISFNQSDIKLLTLMFNHLIDKSVVLFNFYDADVVKFQLELETSAKTLTLDNLYRGRFEENGHLSELSVNGCSYFYVDFYEGLLIELWCSHIEITSFVENLVTVKDGRNS
jgi:hypothetical protein